MASTPILIDVDGLSLAGNLHTPEHTETPDATGASGGNGGPGRARPPGLILGHGFPRGVDGAAKCGLSYPELAERLADNTGWVVLTFHHRGTGTSPGNFSLQGWLNDLRAAVDFFGAHDLSNDNDLSGEGQDLSGDHAVRSVWMAGAGTGGALAICHAANDDRVQGVAALGAQADFDAWAADPAGFLAHARRVGVVRDPDFPTDLGRWANEFRDTRPLAAAAKILPRPFLVVHGDADDQVPTPDARALVDTAGASAELRIVNEAGHLLRHDPRAIAVLMGWMGRQWPGSGA